METLARTRVVYVNNFPGPQYGGGEVHLLHIASGAQAAGLDVTIVALPGSGLAVDARARDLDVVELDITSPASAPARLGAELRRLKADIVHGTGFYTDILARMAGRRSGARIVNAIHTEPAAPLSRDASSKARLGFAARRFVDRVTAGSVDAYVCDSRALARALEQYGADPERIRVVHNSVEPEKLRSEAAENPYPRLDGLIVGTLGRLDAVKGLDVLLDAVPKVLPVVPGARFTIAGGGPDREALAARIADDPVLARPVALAGYVESGAGFLGSLDVYCLPSRSEGFNTTVLEAMALGVPVVCTDVGGMREAVIDGETGLLVPAGDADALADALVRMLAEPSLRTACVERARELVEAEFTVERMVENTLRVYAEVLGCLSEGGAA